MGGGGLDPCVPLIVKLDFVLDKNISTLVELEILFMISLKNFVVKLFMDLRLKSNKVELELTLNWSILKLNSK